MNRLNVPLLGDVAAALLAGLYVVDHVKSFTNFEVSGLKFALLSFVHFDLDGHGANNVMVAERSARSIPRSSRRRGTAAITRRGRAMHACTAPWMKNSLDGPTIAARSCRPQAISFSLCRHRLKV